MSNNVQQQKDLKETCMFDRVECDLFPRVRASGQKPHNV